MSSLIVIVFEGEETAGKVRQSLRSAQSHGMLQVSDAAVVSRDAAGTVRTDNEMSSQMKWGVGIGAAAGLMLTFMFPLVGMAAGAGAGAAIANSLGNSVDPKFVEEVRNGLKPGTSALFVVGTADSLEGVRPVLAPYQGTLIHTNLSPSIEEQIKDALK